MILPTLWLDGAGGFSKKSFINMIFILLSDLEIVFMTLKHNLQNTENKSVFFSWVPVRFLLVL